MGPRATRREASTHAREHTSRARERSCVETTTPTPSSVREAMRRVMMSRLGASRPLKGSSIMTSSGRATSARATRTRWRWPPLSVPKRRVARSARLTRSRASLTRRRMSAVMRLPQPASPIRPMVTTSAALTGKVRSRSALWGTRPIRSAFTSTRPDRTWQPPTTARMSVVFPPPLGPTRARAPPPTTSRVRPDSAGVPPYPSVASRKDTRVAISGPPVARAGPGRCRPRPGSPRACCG